jgi:ABC-type dipeptide/oligopeptide/nickel transport system permease component
MAAYAVRRIVWTIPVLFVVVTMLFFMMRSIGGDPLRPAPLLGLAASQGWFKKGDAKPDAIDANMRRRLGLDRPSYDQYGHYLRAVATFDFGPTNSFRYRTVNSVIRDQAPISAELGLLALAWGLVLGGALGFVSALRAGGVLDAGARAFTSLGAALPAFLVGALLIHLFALRAGLVPTSGWDGWRSKLLPSFVLGLVPAAYCMRLLRAGMLETLRLEYVVAARAKGLRRLRVLFVHVLRNAVGPLVTALRADARVPRNGLLRRRAGLRHPGHRAVLRGGRARPRLPARARPDRCAHAGDRAREPARRPRAGRSRSARARAAGVDSTL